MTLKKHPEVLALFVIVALFGLGGRRDPNPPFALSAAPDRLEQRSTFLCARTESLVTRMQSRIDQVVARLHQRLESRRPRALGL